MINKENSFFLSKKETIKKKKITSMDDLISNIVKKK